VIVSYVFAIPFIAQVLDRPIIEFPWEAWATFCKSRTIGKVILLVDPICESKKQTSHASSSLKGKLENNCTMDIA
jgi:hypothetical protein